MILTSPLAIATHSYWSNAKALCAPVIAQEHWVDAADTLWMIAHKSASAELRFAAAKALTGRGLDLRVRPGLALIAL